MNGNRKLKPLRRLLLSMVAIALLFAGTAPIADAQGDVDDDQELVDLRDGLVQLRASLNSETLRWLALFDPELVPLAQAVADLEADVDRVLATIAVPMEPRQYRLALVQLSDGVASWHAVAAELGPYWDATVIEWETAWNAAVVEWESAWPQATTEWEQAWTETTTEWEQAWNQAVSEWEQAWTETTTEWEQAWTETTTEWEQAWIDAING